MSDALPPPPPSVPSPAPAPEAPKKRRRWLRRLTWFVVFLLVLVTAAPYALALKPVREFVASRISKSIGRTTTIGGASGSWWGGFEVRDVEVRNPDGWQGDPLFSVDRVHVDVKLLALVTGSIDATVDVEKPVVTLLRTTDGRSNADGLMPGEPKSNEKASTSGMPTLVVRVRNGRVVAQEVGAGAGASDEIDAITLDAEMGANGRRKAEFSAVAKRAARGGGDARIQLDTKLSAAGEGPLSMTVPTLDLARLARMVRAATGLEDLKGTFEANARVTFDATGRPSGVVSAALAGLSARRGEGLFAIDNAGLDIKPSVEGDGSAFDITLAIRNFSATGFSRRDQGLGEPSLTLRGRIVRAKNGDLAFGSADAPLSITGRSLSGRISGSVTDLESASAKADVKAHFDVVLSPTLGRLLQAISSPDDDLRGTAAIDASATGKGGAIELLASGSVKDVIVGGAAGATPFREPAITFGAAGAWAGEAKRLTLSKGSVAAGAMSAQVKPGFVVEMGASKGASGEATVDADFARLATLKALMPALDSLGGGKLHAEARLSSGESMKADWSVRAENVAFTPGKLSTNGYVEPLMRMSGSFERTSAGDMIVGLRELASSVAALAPSANGMRIRMSDAGPAVESPGTITVRLEVLGRALDKAVGLKSGESLGGTLDLTASSSTTATGPTFALDLAGRDLRFPGSTTAGTLKGRVVGHRDRKEVTLIDSADLTGYGITMRAVTSIMVDPVFGVAVASATVHVDADLATARPMLGMFMGLPSDAALAGTLVSDVALAPKASDSNAARRMTGRTTINGLHFVGGRDPLKPAATPATFDEPSVVVQHDVTLGTLGVGSIALDTVTLTASLVTARAKGSVRGTEEARVVDLTVDLDADASKVADRLRAFMGAGYEDTTGEGRIKGQMLANGPTGNRLRDLKLDSTLTYARFSSGGVTTENGNVRLLRPDPSKPLTLTLTAMVNQGTVRVDGSCSLGQGESPWSANVQVRHLDTSPLLTSRGAGHYLTLVLPAIVPAEASSNVLSGLLEADLKLQSYAIDQPRLADTLAGSGSVRMTQGTVKDSTIFSSLAGNGAGKGIDALVKLAPGIGNEFKNLSKALMFQSLSSTFTIGNRQLALNPVELISPSAELRFSGTVGFDGTTSLSLPLKLSGDAGKAIEPYIPNRTIPLKVVGSSQGSMRVTPDLSPESLLQSGLLDKGKDVLEGLFGGMK